MLTISTSALDSSLEIQEGLCSLAAKPAVRLVNEHLGQNDSSSI